jgi:hypothetical protein
MEWLVVIYTLFTWKKGKEIFSKDLKRMIF